MCIVSCIFRKLVPAYHSTHTELLLYHVSRRVCEFFCLVGVFYTCLRIHAVFLFRLQRLIKVHAVKKIGGDGIDSGSNVRWHVVHQIVVFAGRGNPYRRICAVIIISASSLPGSLLPVSIISAVRLSSC